MPTYGAQRSSPWARAALGRMVPRCALPGVFALAGVLAFTGWFLHPPLHAHSPSPPPCGGSSASQKAAEGRAVRLAKGVFPGVTFTVTPTGCRHWGGLNSDVMQVPFEAFNLSAPSSGVTFHVNSPMGLFHGRSPQRYLLLPFPSTAAIKETAAALRALPMVRHAFGKGALRCAADTDVPGSTAYLACTTGRAPPSAISLDVSTHFPVVKLRQATDHPGYQGPRTLGRLFGEKSETGPPPMRARPLTVHEYALPVNRLHPEVPTWAAVRQARQVVAFLAKHPGAQVTLKQWHQAYLVLSAPAPSTDNIVVVFAPTRGQGASTHVIHACGNTKPLDCIHQARRR